MKMSKHLAGNKEYPRISVWWDYDNCRLPADAKAAELPRYIRRALARFNCLGPMEIYSYTDVSVRIKPTTLLDLDDAGVQFIHVPPGKEAADKRMMSDMDDWSRDNPACSMFFLISGDGGFSKTLSKFAMLNHRTFVARPKGVTGVKNHMSPYLWSSAEYVWDWHSLSLGEYFDPLDGYQIQQERKGEVFEPGSSNKRGRKRNRVD